MKFKIGDRVKLIEDQDCAEKDWTGTIRRYNANCTYSVEFDFPFGGAHDCDGKCSKDRGHFVREDRMILQDTKPLVYYKKG